MTQYANVTNFNRLQAILSELITQHSKINTFVVSRDLDSMMQFADSCADQIKKRIKFLPAQNSNIIASIKIENFNLIEAMRRLVIAYTGLAQALKDDTLSVVEAQTEFRKNRKQLEKIQASLHDATEQMSFDTSTEANLSDGDEETEETRSPEEVQRSEQLALRAASSLDDKGLKEMRRLAKSTPREVLASKGITLNSLKDLGAYMEMFRKAEREIAEAKDAIRMIETTLNIGVTKNPIPVMETAPSFRQGGGKTGSDVPIKIAQSYHEGKTYSARHEQRHAQRAREKERLMLEGDEANQIKGDIGVLRESRMELAHIPKGPIAEDGWKPCRLPIWVSFDGGFFNVNTWLSVGIHAESYQLGWLLHEQFILALPIALLRKTHREQEERVATIIKVVSARSADTMVNMTQDHKGMIKPFTTGGEKGYCYLWLLEANKLSGLGGHFNINLIGFPSTKPDFMQAVERSNLGRQRDAHKSTMHHSMQQQSEIERLKGLREDVDAEVARQVGNKDTKLGQLAEQRKTLEHQFGMFNDPAQHNELGQELRMQNRKDRVVNVSAIKGIADKIEKLTALIAEFADFEDQETPLKQAITNVKAIQGRIEALNFVLSKTTNPNRRLEISNERDRLIAGPLAQAEALVDQIKGVVDSYRGKLREIKKQEDELKLAARELVLEQRRKANTKT